jgi:hypothetical protein
MHECQYCGRSTCHGQCVADIRDAYARGCLAGREAAAKAVALRLHRFAKDLQEMGDGHTAQLLLDIARLELDWKGKP